MSPQKRPRQTATKLPLKLPPVHPRYDRSQWLLRDIVSIDVLVTDGSSYYFRLTRVPCVGETISEEGRTYRVLRVEHMPVDDDGRSMMGFHAHVFVEEIPEEPVPKRLRIPVKRKRRK